MSGQVLVLTQTGYGDCLVSLGFLLLNHSRYSPSFSFPPVSLSSCLPPSSSSPSLQITLSSLASLTVQPIPGFVFVCGVQF